jgi:hypothetical protein
MFELGMSLAYERASPGQRISHQPRLASSVPARVRGSKTDEFSLELFQSIFGRLGGTATHDQSSHVRALLRQAPLSFSARPIWGEDSLVAS